VVECKPTGSARPFLGVECESIGISSSLSTSDTPGAAGHVNLTTTDGLALVIARVVEENQKSEVDGSL